MLDRWLYRYLPAMDFVGRIFAVVAMMQTAVVVGVMLYEVVARYAFGRPTLWAGDIVWMMNGTLFLIGAAWTLRRNQHVRIDFLATLMPLRLQHFIQCVFYVALFLPLLALVGKATFDKAFNAWKFGELAQASAWEPIIWPFYAGILLGLVLLALQVIAEAIRHGIGVVRPWEVHKPGADPEAEGAAHP